MLKVNLQNGRTLSYDLADPVDAGRWIEQQRDPAFQRQVTGIGVHSGGALHVVPIPSRFSRVSFVGEAIRDQAGVVIGERAGCHADNVRIILSVYRPRGSRPKLVRVDVSRLGRPRFLVPDRPWPQATGERRNGGGAPERRGRRDGLHHDQPSPG